MHSIIGTGKYMKSGLSLILVVLMITSCKSVGDQGGDIIEAKAKVRITHVEHKNLRTYKEIMATSVYLDKSVLTAPASGYIINSMSVSGDHVQKGQLLFTFETKEHKAVSADSTLANGDLGKLGVFSLHAPAGGYISNLTHQQGDYVQEGTVLCTFSRDDHLYFKAFIPFSDKENAQNGSGCEIRLPDSTVLPAVIAKSLNVIDPASQTVETLVKLQKQISVPEGLNAILELPEKIIKDTQVLPQSAVLANETLDKFWVMKLINDTTAVKVPIVTGVRQNALVQITQPQFNQQDRILSGGNYGLPDTAFVEVEKP